MCLSSLRNRHDARTAILHAKLLFNKEFAEPFRQLTP